MTEVLTAREGAVLTISLNRPEVYNAFNRDLHKALAAALKEARDPEVRAVVVTGAGKGFCAGQDLKEFQSLPGGVGDALRFGGSDDLEQLGLHPIVVDEQIGLHAGLLRARHYHSRTRQVSLADCIAAAAVLLVPDVDALATADPDLLDLVDAEGGRTHPLPASDGSIWTPNRAD